MLQTLLLLVFSIIVLVRIILAYMPHLSADMLPLDWHAGCGGVRARCARLLQSATWADCTFAVGAARERVGAHRLLLAASSPVFQDMFFGGSRAATDTSPIPVSNIHMDAFKALLEYIYMDNINLMACSTAYGVYMGAQKYNLPRLRATCVSYLLAQLSPQNACSCYEFADLVGDEELKMKSLAIIKAETRAALAAKSFEALRADTVHKIFSIESLNIESELDLVRAAERHARARARGGAPIEREITSTSSIKVEPCDVTESDNKMIGDKKFQLQDEDGGHPLRKAIQQIRFLALPAQQFCQHDLGALLSVHEINAIALNLISEKTHARMPSGFSTSRIPRNQRNQLNTTANTLICPNPITKANKTLNKQFHTKIDIKYSLGFSIDMFDMHNLTWRLEATPGVAARWRGSSLGIAVTCVPAPAGGGGGGGAWSCQAKLIVRILSHKSRTRPYCVTRVANFTNVRNRNGWNNIISLEELMDPENGFVLRGAVTLHVHVKADEPVCC